MLSWPLDSRAQTMATWNPFTKDTPLLESGLMGPVNLWVEER